MNQSDNFINYQYAIAQDKDVDYGAALDKLEKEFISEAKKIGRKYK